MLSDIKITGIEVLESEGTILSASRQKFLNDLSNAAKTFSNDSVYRVKTDYLSGPRPSRLGTVSARLKSSITGAVATDGDSVSVTVGTNVKYAPIHELGFSGTVSVNAHQRVVKKVFGRVVPGGVRNVAWVTSHTRKVKMPSRPFINPGMRDALPDFERMVEKALLNVGGSSGPVGK